MCARLFDFVVSFSNDAYQLSRACMLTNKYVKYINSGKTNVDKNRSQY